MPSFRYRAASSAGNVQTGVFVARHEGDLVAALAARGLELIAVTPLSSRNAPPFRREGRANRRRSLVLFCRQMEDLLGAGISFLDALAPLAEAFPPGPFRETLACLARDIAQGLSVSDAFARRPDLFDPVFLAILRAGEAAGDLKRAFGLLARQREKAAAEAERRARALRYPLFLVCIVLAVTTFMMMVVVPEVTSFLSSLGGTLPRATRFLIAAANVFAELWLPFLSLLFSATLILALARRFSVAAARGTDGALLRAPFLGTLTWLNARARFTGSLALLLQSGLDLPTALSFAADTLVNRALIEKAHAAREALIAGAPFSSSCAALFTPLALYALRVGETSGTLPAVLARLAESFEREADDQGARFISLIEPILTLAVGALLAWVVLAVLGPIYSNLSVWSAGAG